MEAARAFANLVTHYSTAPSAADRERARPPAGTGGPKPARGEPKQQALKLKPEDPYVLNNYAYYLSLRNEKLEKALEMSKKSNDLQKNNASFLDTYAWIFYKLGKYEDAYIWMLEAKKYSEKITPTIADHIGDILFKLGKTEEAVREWERAKSLGDTRELLDRKIKEKKLYEE